MKSNHFHLALVALVAVVSVAALVIGSGNVLAYLIHNILVVCPVTEKILCRESSLNEILSTFFH